MKRLISFFVVVVLAATLSPLGVVIGASYEQVAKLTASDSATYTYFGIAVSISGDTIVVGADWDNEIAANAGAAYVFERNQGGANQWGEVKKLTASDGATLDLFGVSVSIDGDTIVVGAPYDDDKGTDSGSGYVFGRNQGGANQWGLLKKLTASDGAGGDLFGHSVSISGDTIVVGALYDDNANGSEAGSAYVFERNEGGDNQWGQVKKLTALDGAAYDSFGWATSISGDTILVGAREDDDDGSNSGSAYVFERNQPAADQWGEVKKLTASDGAGGDLFGYSVSISGDTVVVGAYGDDDSGADSGSAYVFERNEPAANQWSEVKKLTASDGAASDYFGFAVSINGDTVVVGAFYDDNANGSDAGSAYAFQRDEGGADNWGEVTKLTASDGAADDYLGVSVFVSGDTIVVGAEGDDDKGETSGSAYVFQISSPEQPPSGPPGVPGVSFWGNVVLVLVLAGAMVWSVRRRDVAAEAR